MRAVLPRGVAASVKRRLTPEPERELPADPVKWIREDLSEHVWSHQVKLLRSAVENRRTAWQACHGPGKSFIVSRLIAWWLAAHPPGEAFVVTSAPSGHQVRAILWREIRRAQRKGGLPGFITDSQVPEWKINGEMVAFGRKPQDLKDATQAATVFQGIHARYLLVVLDESCGIPKWLWTAVLSLLTNESARVVAIGNPDDPSTEFERICQPGSGWNVLQTSVFDTPNYTDEWVPEDLRELLPSRLWAEEMAREWGVDSPTYTAKVLGLFPETSDDVIITPRLVREAQERELPGLGRGRYGMDVARFGADETCIYRNRDGVIRLAELPRVILGDDGAPIDDPLRGQPAVWRGADTHVSRLRAQALMRADPYIEMSVDVVGLGAGVYDPLNAADLPVVPYSGGEAAADALRFANRNAEAWWAFREAMSEGLIDLDPEDLKLAAQLQSRKWKLDTSQRRIRIETKDEMRERGLPSPDRADAAIMSWYQGGRVVGDPSTVLHKPEERAPASIAGDLIGKAT